MFAFGDGQYGRNVTILPDLAVDKLLVQLALSGLGGRGYGDFYRLVEWTPAPGSNYRAFILWRKVNLG